MSLKLNKLMQFLVPALNMQMMMAEGSGGSIDPLDDMDDVIDVSIDDLKDLPEFKVPPTGIYDLHVTVSGKNINDKPAVVAKIVVIEAVELVDGDTIPEEDKAKAGDSFDVAFIMKNADGTKNEFAEGRLKEFVAPFAEHFGEQNVKALIRGHLQENVQVRAKITKKQRKNDKEKFDAQISDITIA